MRGGVCCGGVGRAILKLFCFVMILASQIYERLQKKGFLGCYPFFISHNTAVNFPGGFPCPSSPLTLISCSGSATAQIPGFGALTVYVHLQADSLAKKGAVPGISGAGTDAPGVIGASPAVPSTFGAASTCR